MHLGTIVTEIRWKRGQVIMQCVSGAGAQLETLRARAAIVTIPHAVLKAKGLNFMPGLSEKQGAVERLEAGQVFKMIFWFRAAFWEEDKFVQSRLEKRAQGSEQLRYVHAEDADVPVWWTTLPFRSPVLTAWAGGPKGESLLNESEHTRLDRCLAALAQVFGVPRRVVDELLECWSIHDWRGDPFSRAAYMYIPAGAMAAQKVLGKTVEGTLFFAGEATNLEEMGTVAGAIRSGRKAARELLHSLRS